MREFFDKQSSDKQLKLNPDCLDEVKDQASQRMKKYQQKMAEYFNQRVKLRRFNIRGLVLRKVTPMTNDPTQGELDPTWEWPYKVVHYSQQGLEDMDGNRLPRLWNIEHLKRYYK